MLAVSDTLNRLPTFIVEVGYCHGKGDSRRSRFTTPGPETG